ncbi:mRNA decapping [Seminavis robusta]|uniref:mRNA decapping n=1 Tax=Seminavis robusta TaxID=568900 RepID=A0A9N8DEP3_9STRA|nr:mRNA decapping [Seminavis robusta]|eukprot:Sro87_g046200.1 mRNA decapping (599) ;mRNA; f:99776-101572
MTSNTATTSATLPNWHSPVSEIDDPAVLQAFQDALEDVHTRFLLNLPSEELATADRILFQIEQAWWFYEDWICDQQQAAQQESLLPRFKHLKPFAVEMFQFSPLLQIAQFPAMWDKFSKYKRKISTYGCILLNVDCTKIVLCQDYNSKSWTFPAGKINQGEEGIDAATRETYEETGFDVNCRLGLTQQQQQHATTTTWKHPLQEKDAVAFTEDGGKHRTYYICHGVPEEFPFGPVVRKEIAAVEWHPLEKVPKRNYAVLPILPKVRRWIKRNVHNNKTPKKGRDKSNQRAKSNPKQIIQQQQQQRQATPTNNNKQNNNNTPLKSNKTPGRKGQDSNTTNRKTPNRGDRKKQGSRGKVRQDDPLLVTGLAAVGAENRWSEEEMFQANERILGRKIEYDGNPHVFSEEGFQGMDPHHFHIVGGNFLNSNTATLAPPPPTSRLQHLFHSGGNAAAAGGSDPEVLTPFFSNDGATPWGEVVPEVKESVASPERHLMLTDRSSTKLATTKPPPKKKNPKAIMATADNDSDLVFMTDEEITAKSQKEKLAGNNRQQQRLEQQYQQDVLDVQRWVKSLPQGPPTERFGEFKFNVDALMDAFYAHY